jgi:hypothetical protein
VECTHALARMLQEKKRHTKRLPIADQ